MAKKTEGNSVNGWDKMAVYVLKELERLNDCMTEIEAVVNKIHVELQVHKERFRNKAGVWGLMGGAIPVAIMIAVYFIKTVIDKKT